MKDDTTVYESKGNVFADLGLPDADERLAKAEMAHQITQIIKRRKLTQKAVAAQLDIDQPKISALMRGKLSGFSTERLIRFLNMLDRDVEIVIKPKRRSQEHGVIRVAAL